MATHRECLVEPERVLFYGGTPPETPDRYDADRKLEITVLFTLPKPTAAATRRAAGLLSGLDGRIRLVDVQTVPYSLPLDSPPLSADFTERRLLAIARRSTVETTAQVLLCRFRFETLLRVLKPDSPVVIGSRRKWWPTWEKRLARKLQQAGYQTVLIESN